MAVDFKPLITILAIVNPLACVPFFIHYTQGMGKAERRKTIEVASFSAFAVIAACALLGLQILEFFGISLAQPIARLLGKTGINVMTRLMGLILAALAVEVMADGLHTLFPVLAAK